MKGWIGRSVWGSGTAGGDAGGLGAVMGTVGVLFPRDPVSWSSRSRGQPCKTLASGDGGDHRESVQRNCHSCSDFSGSCLPDYGETVTLLIGFECL